MIYLTNTTELQEIRIPNSYGFTAGVECRLLILSTVDLVEFDRRYANGGSYDAAAFSSAFRIGTSSPVTQTADGRYINFLVAFDTAPVVGSFEYRLLQGNKLVGGGCCQVGEYGEEEDIYEVPTEQYDRTIQYNQYD